ncbi:uncharacterized protein LOC120141123 [Hibiscus syriacus]|uniref:uncharacterized protein LOC120141123 n=1 Tax=Hibiscus syriacus TaxID=106335 RepID=UPI00192418F6|nr:uncharacterized protein LOC120141123 [Hibiscus syriacus]
MAAKGARVSWKHIFLMKSEGGLGVIDLKGWNRACIGLLIKKLLANEGSVWVAWVRSYVIKDLDFWQMSAPVNASWCLKKILKMRYDVSQLPSGSINDLSIRKLWEELRTQNPKVPWHRLPTPTRLLRIGLSLDNDKWLLCGYEPESISHLFFGCAFAKDLWGKILSLCGMVRNVSTWNRELDWAIRLLKGNSFIVQVVKLALASHVHGIWRERNNRLFGGRGRCVDELLNDIREDIQIRVQGWSSNTTDSRNVNLCTSWGISC